jgi:hypothetical protein
VIATSGPKSREETPKKGMATTTLSHRDKMRVRCTKVNRQIQLIETNLGRGLDIRLDKRDSYMSRPVARRPKDHSTT